MTDSQTQDKIENVETLEGDIKEDKSPKKDEEFEVKSEYYQIESDIPEHTHDGIVSPKINFSDLNGRPTLIERTATSIDLSGAAETLIVFHTEREATITNAYFLYTEATSADAGITIKIGKEEDDVSTSCHDCPATKVAKEFECVFHCVRVKRFGNALSSKTAL